jgi:hypothetical protein
MEFNSYLFPKPKQSYTTDHFKGDLIWIPRIENFTYRDKYKYTNFKTDELAKQFHQIHIKKRSLSIGCNLITQKVPSLSFSIDNKFTTEGNTPNTYIPCLYLRNADNKSSKLILYFHANYEDLGLTYNLASKLCKYLKYNILCVEYPGYGVYKSSTPCTADELIKDSEIVYKFLTGIMNISESNIIIMGRCVGSGPAIHLASKNTPLSLVLISPFMSIKSAAYSVFSSIFVGWLVEKIVKER